MSSETRIPVICPVCKKTLSVDLAELDRPDQVVYMDARRRRVETYRVKCPRDGTYVVFDVQVEEE